MTGLLASCGGKNPPPPLAVKPAGPVVVHRGELANRVFSAEDEVPTTSYEFEGARGSVRVTMEVETVGGTATTTSVSLNDILFRAEGKGKVQVAFKRPYPEHPNGRVTIRCVSGSEESSAEFEPELWFHRPSAIVTFESVAGEPSDRVVEGKEVVLGRYVARNIARDVRLTFKAVFAREPVEPRTRAGIKTRSLAVSGLQSFEPGR